jgi:uncharacterized membrane protein YfcA
MGWEELLVAIAGFVSTLASNGSSVTLPALDLLGLPEHVDNGTNRLSVVALRLVGTISFYREGLIDWRKGARIAVLIALGTDAGSFIAVDLSDVILDAIVVGGLLLVLGLLLARPGRWLEGRVGTLRPFGWARWPLTSPSASTRAWWSSARASSCSPRWSCSRAAT